MQQWEELGKSWHLRRETSASAGEEATVRKAGVAYPEERDAGSGKFS